MTFYHRPAKIYLFGDSFMKGFALGTFLPSLSPSNPLIDVAAPERLGNMVLAENDLPFRFSFDANLTYGDFYKNDTFPAAFAAWIATGEARSRDWFIFEDAGPHGSDPHNYETRWKSVLTTAATASGVNRAVMTMFDYSPAPANSQYDLAIGGKTTNDATRAAAAATFTPLLDMNAAMDARRLLLQADGSDVIRSDGIHPNVWGNIAFVGAIFKHIGLSPALRSYATLTTIASANYTSLAYGATTGWTADKAVAHCAAILG